MCTRVGPPVYRLCVLAGFVVSAVCALCYSTFFLLLGYKNTFDLKLVLFLLLQVRNLCYMVSRREKLKLLQSKAQEQMFNLHVKLMNQEESAGETLSVGPVTGCSSNVEQRGHLRACGRCWLDWRA